MCLWAEFKVQFDFPVPDCSCSTVYFYDDHLLFQKFSKCYQCRKLQNVIKIGTRAHPDPDSSFSDLEWAQGGSHLELLSEDSTSLLIPSIHFLVLPIAWNLCSDGLLWHLNLCYNTVQRCFCSVGIHNNYWNHNS